MRLHELNITDFTYLAGVSLTIMFTYLAAVTFLAGISSTIMFAE